MMPLIIGEVIAVALVIGGFALLGVANIYRADLGKVALGAALGAIIILANHLWLSFTVDKEIKKYLEIRGSGEMNDEEIEIFTKKHSAAIQGAMKLSSLIRTVSMLVMLVVAFITGWFNPIATAIPMLAFRFVISAAEVIKSKNNPKPDPSKFIKYEDGDENTDEEKEDK